MPKPFLDVAVGVLSQDDGKILLNQRPDGKPWAGWWELPGGKLEPGETAVQALVRELHEELGIRVRQATPWVTYTHDYPKTTVRLRFHRVQSWDGQVTGREGQKLAWMHPTAATDIEALLPAALPPLRWATLPDRYLITSIGTPEQLPCYLKMLRSALQQGVKLVQFREPAWQASEHCKTTLHKALLEVVAACHKAGAACLLNSVHPVAWQADADGVHYRAHDAAKAVAELTAPAPQDYAFLSADAHAAHSSLPGALRHDRYVAVSAHNAHELMAARQLQADFVVIGHVLPTPSHAKAPALGWRAFESLTQQAGIPALALGGQNLQTLETAKQHGAHGIAAIRGLLG